MQYNVSQLFTEPPGSQWDLVVDEDAATEEGGRERVTGTLRLTLFDEEVWAKARLALEVDEICVRCLRGFRQPVDASIEEVFHRPGAETTAGAPDPDAGDQFINDDGLLDLREVFRQHLILNRPVKPVCRRQCRGICPACGADANGHSCPELNQDIDARWTGLAALSAVGERET